MLDSDRHSDAVREDETQARRYGITGVPFFVIDDKYGISGAQPAAALRQALDTAWADAHPQTPLVMPAAAATGVSACTDDGCAI